MREITQSIKISKSVTFEMDNLLIINELMGRTKRNFSYCVNLVIKNWVTTRKLLKEANEEQQTPEQRQHQEYINKRTQEMRKKCG